MRLCSVALVLGGAIGAQAHMQVRCITTTTLMRQMSWPYPFRSALDPTNPWNAVDYSMTNPLQVSGADYPCKGYIDSTTPVKAILTAGSPCVLATVS